MKKVLYCFGTRPEAIKMAPLIKKSADYGFEPYVCLTGQHKEMLKPFIEFFDLPVHKNLEIMKSAQSLTHISASILTSMESVLEEINPDVVMVQGDTSTTFTSALAAFYKKIPIGHVEAGLRTYNKYSPFPEEANRQMTTSLSDFHFAPTDLAARNLANEGVKKNVFVTGNTSIDSIRYTLDHLDQDELVKKFPNVDFSKRIILVTAHRRENLGAPMEDIFNGIKDIVSKLEDVEVVFPVHMNPKVREISDRILKGVERVHLFEPFEYTTFVFMMKQCHVILSDSGGVQEEAPFLDKPVLVLRENTERPEGVESGTSILVRTNRENIVENVSDLLTNQKLYENIQSKANPFGDGYAADKILKVLKSNLH